MTDFSNIKVTETQYVCLGMTEDRTVAYGMGPDDYIYRSYDGESWERVNIKEKYFFEFVGPAGGDEVIIVDQSTNSSAYAIVYWINSKGFTTFNMEVRDFYKGKWQATKGYLYYSETHVYGGDRYYNVYRMNKAGVKALIYSYNRNSLYTSPVYSFYASDGNVMLSDLHDNLYYITEKGLQATFLNKGWVYVFQKTAENEYVVLVGETQDAGAYGTTSVKYTLYKFDSEKKTLTKITSVSISQHMGSSYAHVYFVAIKNELQNSIYFQFEDEPDSYQLTYSIYCYDINTSSFRMIVGGDISVSLPVDIGAGQLVFYEYKNNYTIANYTSEGGTSWNSQIIQKGSSSYGLATMKLMQNGTLLGGYAKAKINVKNSGVKIFIDGEKKDLRAYNLTNPNAIIRLKKIHAINAQGEHVVLYDREVPEPRKKHVCYFDGEMVRYIYSV